MFGPVSARLGLGTASSGQARLEKTGLKSIWVAGSGRSVYRVIELFKSNPLGVVRKSQRLVREKMDLCMRRPHSA